MNILKLNPKTIRPKLTALNIPDTVITTLLSEETREDIRSAIREVLALSLYPGFDSINIDEDEEREALEVLNKLEKLFSLI